MLTISEAARSRYGFAGDGGHRVFGEDINIYPYDYFSAARGGGKGYDITENTHTVHEFAGSWLSRPVIKNRLGGVLKIVEREDRLKVKFLGITVYRKILRS